MKKHPFANWYHLIPPFLESLYLINTKSCFRKVNFGVWTDRQIGFCGKMWIREDSYNKKKKKKRRCYVIKADQKRTMILSKQEENESGVGAGEGKRKKQQQPRIGIFLKQC